MIAWVIFGLACLVFGGVVGYYLESRKKDEIAEGYKRQADAWHRIVLNQRAALDKRFQERTGIKWNKNKPDTSERP